ncbi:hypothetical protein OGAPHI_007283 [Ogataea philodendri]|uniref:holo-[acyl-carrier-protein] synthase n=1 Tax=Ogataea philodendri TaxID=1378263 RepID=A0A9P8SYV3_9ASCO|nr:uncharacterized protein OGAPHI_007283 [Ogataea philodendri]KAH3660078.1 hypothetical protein OGAPHI_007283 [Ogataea philodendri]
MDPNEPFLQDAHSSKFAVFWVDMDGCDEVLNDDFEFEQLIRTLPLTLQAKILKRRNKTDRHCGLVGALLTRYAVWGSEKSLKKWNDLEFGTGELGKPFVKNRPYKFNHSDEHKLVAVAVDFTGSSEVGVDLANPEDVGDPNKFVGEFEAIFTESELAEVTSSVFGLSEQAAKQHLSLYWALKESYSKYKGVGLHHELKSYEFRNVSPVKPYPQSTEFNGQHAVYMLLPHNTICSVVSDIRQIPNFVQIHGAELLHYIIHNICSPPQLSQKLCI